MKEKSKNTLTIEGEVITINGKKHKWILTVKIDGKIRQQLKSKTTFDSIARAQIKLHKEARKQVAIYSNLSEGVRIEQAKGIEIKPKKGLDVQTGKV